MRIEIGPTTWKGTMPLLFELLINGDRRGVTYAKEQLMRLARAVDANNEEIESDDARPGWDGVGLSPGWDDKLGDKYEKKATALARARDLEAEDGESRWIAWSVVDREWHVVDRIPLLGECFDTDGIRHGDATDDQ